MTASAAISLALRPVLTAWTGSGITTLREITSDHVVSAVDGLARGPRRQLAVVLRSLFRALRQERVIFRIEEFTYLLASEWLTYRHQRWPASTNPHLLVSQRTALDPDHPPISRTVLQRVLPKGVTLDGLRQDRILNEAFETADR
ncbi:hypothetical protein ACFWBF_19915 [Streptomyces sp. NPDC060028]|uniref:hypothetical protein n=1 Tax=Streptomyces sp. NPDC060028 TaxID=3347041 RepID=UPI0036A0124A